MNLKDMSELFDVDLDGLDANEDESSDYDSKPGDTPHRSFDEQIADVKAVTSGPETDLIIGAMDSAKKGKIVPPKRNDPELESVAEPQPAERFEGFGPTDLEEDMEIPGDIEEAVDRDIEAMARELGGPAAGSEVEIETNTDSVVVTPESTEVSLDPDLVDELDDVISPAKPEGTENAKTSTATQKEDYNPLGLDNPSDLKAFHQISKKFPQFTLYDGSPAFVSFYQQKTIALKTLLSSFALLDVPDLAEQLKEVKINLFIGEKQVVTPDLIRVRLDECCRARVRVTELLTIVLGQFYAWERYCEMLRSKLWKDHEMKGAHRRDGLTIEHMPDIEKYVADMRGFLEQATRYDNMLKAAHDSLSRQLGCLQELREPTGFTQNMEVKLRQPTPPAINSSEFDGLDTIDEGTVIRKPAFKREATDVNFGVEADDLAELG